jgi:hypothetical protein
VVLAALLVGLLTTAVTEAAVILPQFDVDFENGTAGSPPPTSPAVAGGVSTNATAYFAGGTTTVLIQNGYTDTGTGFTFGNGKALVLGDNDVANSWVVRFNGDSADAASAGGVRIGWDMLVDSAIPGKTLNAWLILRDSGDSPIAASAFTMDGAIYMFTYTSAGVPGPASLVGSLTLGTNVHFDVVLDFSTGKQSLFMDGTFLAAGNFGANTDFLRSDFSSTSPMIGVIALDNFLIVEHVPEPSVAALLTLAGAILWRRVRK